MEEYIKQKNKKVISKYLKIIILLIMVIASNNAIIKATDDTVISSTNWEEWQKEDYWEWHTRTTTDDKAYNGNHIVIENDVIDFYGYGQISYKDFLYKEYKNPGKKIFKFRIDETKANYHTLEGAGFIFNASKIEDKFSGYVILFKEKTVCLYRLDNVDINTFETTPNTTMDTYGKLILSKDKSDSTIRDLVVEVTPTSIKITESGTEIINVNLDYNIHTGESFGLISSYVQHDCAILSNIEFSQIQMIIEDYKVSVLNTDLNGTPISGGYFELKNENGEIIKEGKTDNDGTFNIEGIKEGIYTIQQKTPPENFILNDTVYKFKVTNEGKVVDIDTGEEINLIVKNEKIKEESKNNVNNITDNEDNNSIISEEKDNTISSIPIPNAGEKAWMIGIAIVLVISLSIYLVIKLKEYKI